MYTTDITIRVLGYLIGEGENDDRQLVKVEENFVEITFPMESTVKEDDEGFFNITSWEKLKNTLLAPDLLFKYDYKGNYKVVYKGSF